MLIDWFTVGAQLVNFLILVWLLKRFLYKPVLAAIDQREKDIAAKLGDAEKKKAEAEKEQGDFQHRNEEFERQRAGLLLEATNAAKAEREKLLDAARKDAEALRSKLQKATSDERDSLSLKVGTLAREEVFAIARKTLSDLAGSSLEERIADVFMQRLRDLDGQQKEALKAGLEDPSKPALVRSAFELPLPQRKGIEDALKPLLHEGTGIVFEVKPDLIGGIELAAGGQKIGWSIAGYLTDLTGAVGSLLQPETPPAPVATAAPEKALPRAA